MTVMGQGDQPPSLGDQVRLRRLEVGLTQEQLANSAGVTLSTVRNIERGRTERSYLLPQVLRVLGMEDDSEERRLRNRLLAAGIPDEYATKAAKIIAEGAPPTPGPGRTERPA